MGLSVELGMGIEPITVGDIAKNNLFYAAPFSFFNIKVQVPAGAYRVCDLGRRAEAATG